MGGRVDSDNPSFNRVPGCAQPRPRLPLATTWDRVHSLTAHRSTGHPLRGAHSPIPATPWPETPAPPAGSISPRRLPGIVVPSSPGASRLCLEVSESGLRTSGPRAGVAVVGASDPAGSEAPAASRPGDSLRPSVERARVAEPRLQSWRTLGGVLCSGVRWAAPSDVCWGGSGFLSGLGRGPWAGSSHCFSVVPQPSLVGAHSPQRA